MGRASLVVETSSSRGHGQIVHPITIAREHKLFLYSDKPAYRRGQTIHMRVLALDATNLKPAAYQLVSLSIFDPNGELLAQHKTQTSEFGIATHDFDLPSGAAEGQYTLRATLGDTVSERAVEVGAYELPAFRVAVETDHTFYGPGEQMTGFAQAEYFFGKPVVGGQVTLRGYLYDAEPRQVIELYGQIGESGRFEFGFDLPDLISYCFVKLRTFLHNPLFP